MPAILFTINGTLKSNIEKLRNIETMKEEDVLEKTEREVIDMLNSGKYSLSVEDAIANATWSEIETDNYEEDV